MDMKDRKLGTQIREVFDLLCLLLQQGGGLVKQSRNILKSSLPLSRGGLGWGQKNVGINKFNPVSAFLFSLRFQQTHTNSRW